MTFAIRNLSVLSYAQGFTLWHYRAGAARLDDVATLGFFNNAGDLLKVGDMMMITAIDGGRIVFVASTAIGVRIGALV
jgi:hypothetical protein